MNGNRFVARRTPLRMRHATNSDFGATSDATAARQVSLKALADAVLQRDTDARRPMRQGEKSVRQTGVKNCGSVACDSRANEVRARLRALAEAAGIEPEPIDTLTAADLATCTGMPDAVLIAYARALADTADRIQGKVPSGYTTPTICAHCGPVWGFGKTGADGWAHVLGCPWCHVHGHVPRPKIASGTCRHFKPDPMNPIAGRGQCACGSSWPMQRHACAGYQPKTKP